MQFENPFGVAQAIELAGSAAVIVLMVGAAALLGFRMSARIDEAELARLASAEGVRIEHAVIAQNGRAALAQLSDGRVMVARVMGADVSARFAPVRSVQVGVKPGRLSATFADVGFPPLKMRIDGAPQWLDALSRGDAKP
jgi:hypothetical protein